MTDQFFWIANHPGLDFVNTEAVDAGGRPLELLYDWDSVVGWAEAAGLVDADIARDAATLSVGRARRRVAWARMLRTAAREVVTPGRPGRQGGATRLADVVAQVPVSLTYRPEDGRHQSRSASVDAHARQRAVSVQVGQQVAVVVGAAGPADTVRLELALAVLDATRLDRSRIRTCASDRCGLLYYDTSKNGSRRWCDMSVCGNRAKSAAHYERTKRRRARVRGSGEPHTPGPASVGPI
ncbi:MAG: CGNR zinc finger domain-containing protein [Acidimicrobiales bacterium]